MKFVTFMTGNAGKFKIAQDIFCHYQIDLRQNPIETPEVQSLKVEEVAGFSVSYAAERHGGNLMKSDVGYYIPSLGNFPGPFIKFINLTLTPEDVLRLMVGKQDRSILLKECLAFIGGDRKPVFFVSEQRATIAKEMEGEGSTIDRLLVLDGFSKPKAAYPPEEIFEHWKKSLGAYHDLAKHILQMG